MSKICEDCSKEAYRIATSYMYESLDFFLGGYMAGKLLYIYYPSNYGETT